VEKASSSLFTVYTCCKRRQLIFSDFPFELCMFYFHDDTSVIMCRPGQIQKRGNLCLRIFPTLSLQLGLMDPDRTIINLISNQFKHPLLDIAM
jgi:hypothetical protein